MNFAFASKVGDAGAGEEVPAPEHAASKLATAITAKHLMLQTVVACSSAFAILSGLAGLGLPPMATYECSNCNAVKAGIPLTATEWTCYHCHAVNHVSAVMIRDEKAKTRRMYTTVGLVVGAIALLVAALLLSNDGTGSGSGSESNALDQRTCEIARDIAASFQVTDTVDDSRQRVADLYSGYGVSASSSISAGIRTWSTGMTTGDYHMAAQGLSQTSTACAAEGY
jgi:hypothetical protein